MKDLRSAISRPLFEGFFMETSHQVLPFFDIGSRNQVATLLGFDLAFLEKTAERHQNGDATVRMIRKNIRGKVRSVHEPIDDDLKQVLSTLVRAMTLTTCSFLRSTPVVHGYMAGRSAHSNAAAHVGSLYVQKFDIKNFFPSVSRTMVSETLQNLGMSSDAAELIADLTTRDDSLPLGYAPSPLISNLILVPADQEFLRVATEHNLVVTRYADDLTFSGDSYFDLTPRVSAILVAQGFELNPTKTISGRLSDGIRITGFSVTPSEARLPQRLKRAIRLDLFYLDRNGLDAQAAARGRTPESFSRRMTSRMGILRSCEPRYYEQLAVQFPQAVAALEHRRQLAVARRARRRQRLATELLSNPLPKPALYVPTTTWAPLPATWNPASQSTANGASAWDPI